MICSVENCETEVYAKGKRYGYCRMHLRRFQRHGDPTTRLYVKGGKKCSVDGCERSGITGDFCNLHHKRFVRHGDPLVTVNVANKGLVCSVNGCQNEAFSRGYCNTHYGTITKYGRDYKIIAARGDGTLTKDGYKLLTINGRRVLEHVYLAEKALGKKLPDGVIVHHMNEDRLDNYSYCNLIVCPDQAYHMFLHQRMRTIKQQLNTISAQELDI